MNNNDQFNAVDAVFTAIENKSQEELEKIHEKLTHEKFYKRWVERFHQYNKNERATIIRKVMVKYHSDAYINKEIRLGYEPREDLFWILYEYAKVYGEALPAEGNFVADSYMVDDRFRVDLLIGQGSMIRVDEFIESDESEDLELTKMAEEWIKKGNEDFDVESWEFDYSFVVKAFKEGYKKSKIRAMRIFKHNKTGNLYELVQEHLLFKDWDGEKILPNRYQWRKEDELVLYRSLYDNPDGPYFVRHAKDFFDNFTEQ